MKSIQKETKLQSETIEEELEVRRVTCQETQDA
jgi:hypothetical protein